MWGIGTDIVRIARVSRLRARYPTRFPARILHVDEMPDYRRSTNKDAFLARRFAAKEAISKALGSGFSGLAARSIRIRHNRRGRPEVVWHQDDKPPKPALIISMADEKEYATAVALAVAPPREATAESLAP